MADLTLSQPERRNLLVPILLAVGVLLLVTFVVLRFTPHDTADVAVTRTAVYPSHIVFKSQTIVLNSDQVQDDIYVLATLRIVNHLRLPLFLKDFTASLSPTAATGGLPLTASAIEKADLPNVLATFPALGKLAAAQGSPPLFRETSIDPGKTAEGYILLHFPGKQTVWDTRQSASISIDLYHQPPLTVAIPGNAQAAK